MRQRSLSSAWEPYRVSYEIVSLRDPSRVVPYCTVPTRSVSKARHFNCNIRLYRRTQCSLFSQDIIRAYRKVRIYRKINICRKINIYRKVPLERAAGDPGTIPGAATDTRHRTPPTRRSPAPDRRKAPGYKEFSRKEWLQAKEDGICNRSTLTVMPTVAGETVGTKPKTAPSNEKHVTAR